MKACQFFEIGFAQNKTNNIQLTQGWQLFHLTHYFSASTSHRKQQLQHLKTLELRCFLEAVVPQLESECHCTSEGNSR